MRKLLIVFFFSLAATCAQAELCEKAAEVVDKYLPDEVGRLLSVRSNFCAKNPSLFHVSEKLQYALSDITLDSVKALTGPIETSVYAFAKKDSAVTRGMPIDIEAENEPVSKLILHLKEKIIQKPYQLIIVPGFSPADAPNPIQLHEKAKERAQLGLKTMHEFGIPFIFLTGGNVHPKDTPFNEAYEMKRYLIDELKVPDYLIAIDPYAQHSTTNIRNAGRFMSAHGLKSALIVTTAEHGLYFGYADRSTFEARTISTLGYSLGKFDLIDMFKIAYSPSPLVIRKGFDPKDP